MKRALVTFVVCFAGVFLALQANIWLQKSGGNEPLKQPWVESTLVAEPSQAAALGVDFREPARKLLRSVVSVEILSRDWNLFGERIVSPSGAGSGVVISKDGYVVTNNHVVRGADIVRVQLVDKRVFDAKVVGVDPRADLAVLKVNATNLTPAELGTSSGLSVGEWVLAAGNPLGYDNTVSVGVVSSLGRTFEAGQGRGANVMVDMIQTDAAINQGNSGGALANSRGQVVGINTAIASIGGGSIGIGFAIPVDRVKRVVADIIAYGRVRYGSLGVTTHPRSAFVLNYRDTRAELQGLHGSEPPREGMVVDSVASDSPAYKLGIRRFDVLLSINGQAVNDMAALRKITMDKRPGEKVSVKYWSKGQTRTGDVVLADLGA